MKKYFAMAAVATMMAACTNSDEVVSQVDELTGTPIRVTARVASPVDSRAVAGNDSEADIVSDFYLKIVNESSAAHSYYAMMRYDNASSSWKSYEFSNTADATELPMYWQNSTTKVKVTAIYEMGMGWTENNFNSFGNVTVSNDQASQEYFYLMSDILYMSTKEVTPSASGIAVEFKHLMSKVVLSIDTKTTETTNPVTDVKIGGTAYTRRFSPTTGAWDDVYSDFVKEITPCLDTYDDGTATYAAILVPQEVAANGFYVSFVMGGKTYKWTSTAAVTLDSGKEYTLALSVPEPVSDTGTTAVKLASIAVAQWDDDVNNVIGSSTNEADVVPETTEGE